MNIKKWWHHFTTNSHQGIFVYDVTWLYELLTIASIESVFIWHKASQIYSFKASFSVPELLISVVI